MKKEDWRTARAGVKKFKARKDLDRSRTCRYAVENRDGKQHVFYQDYCHAGLSKWNMNDAYKTLGGQKNFDPITIINLLCEPRAGEDAARRFYEWLFNYSPFAKVFITKSVKRAMSDNISLVSPEYQGDLMVGALIATRLVSEDYNRNGNYRCGVVWDKLVQNGVHPSLAFVVAHAAKPDIDLGNVIIKPMGHGVFNVGPDYYNDTIDTLDKWAWPFLENRPINFLHQPWAKEPSYGHVSATWTDTTNKRKDVHNAFTSAIAAVKKQAQVKNNPFAVDVANIIPLNPFIEELAPKLRDVLVQKEIAIAA